MKILQMNPAFYPAFAYGGTVNVSYNLSKALVKRGHDVTVFTSDTIDKHTRQRELYLEHEGLKIHYFRNVSNLLAWHRYLLYPGLVRALRDHIQEFDIVHLHDYRCFQNIVAAHYAKKYGVPYVVQPHGSLPNHFGKQKLKKLFDIAWGEDILQNAEGIIALTYLEAAQAKKMGVEEDKVHIIANGIDLSQYENTPPQGGFRALYNIPLDTRVVLFLGRLHPIKGVDLLIRAFKIVSKEMDNCVLVVAGPDDGSLLEMKSLTEKLNLCEKVIFTGPLYDMDKFAAYCDSDVLVYPSVYEIFGLVPFEALLCGTPVIVTQDCGCGEIVKEAECGYLVRYGDVAGLAGTLRFALEHPDVNRRMVEAGKRYIEKRVAWECVVKQFEEMYESCH